MELPNDYVHLTLFARLGPSYSFVKSSRIEKPSLDIHIISSVDLTTLQNTIHLSTNSITKSLMAETIPTATHPIGPEVAGLIYQYLHHAILLLFHHVHVALLGSQYVYIVSVHDFEQSHAGPGGSHKVYGVFFHENHALRALEQIRLVPEFAGREMRFHGVMKIYSGECGVPVLAPTRCHDGGSDVVAIVQRIETRLSASC